MTTLQEKQAPIDAEIIKAMIASTPETWTAIRLVIDRSTGTNSLGRFTHELSSPEGHGPVAPDVAMFDATFRLDTLLQAHGGILRRAEYVARLDGENWRYTCTFEYAGKAL